MKLYLISQDVNNGYDTYDSAVVAAETGEEARRISPSSYRECGENDQWYFAYCDGTKLVEEFDSWAPVTSVEVEYIGEAKPGTVKGLILASFHAG